MDIDGVHNDELAVTRRTIQQMIAQLRSIPIQNDLCPGCGGAIELHGEDGCSINDPEHLPKTSPVVCPCLLTPKAIRMILESWSQTQPVE